MLAGSHSYSSPTESTATSGVAGNDTSGAPSVNSTFYMTDGWYVAIACVFGIMTANTRLGPYVIGILGIALIYQTTLMIEGK